MAELDGVVAHPARKVRADFRTAEAEAARVLRDFGLDRPPINPVEIAEQLGVRVVFAEFADDAKSVSGFYDADERAIYVNRDEYPFRQTFTVAHELGHHLLHGEWARSAQYKVLLRESEAAPDPYEQEANAFAAHLLVPKVMLDKYKSIANETQLSRLFLVSVPVVKNRLTHEGKRAK